VVKVVAPGDIAIYGTLCALPTLSRNTLKSEIWSSTTFALYVEQEPYVRDLIEAFMTSNFKTALDILSRYSVSCGHRHHLSALSQRIDAVRRPVTTLTSTWLLTSITL
jgi:COP9 signalosome complex subunit 1